MNFKPGDRVIFLNEKGGGIITRIIDDNVVHVAIDDGFEIPYAVRDLLKAGGNDSGEGRRGSVAWQEEPEDENLSPLYSVPNDPHQRASGVYLAMVPQNQDKLLESPLDLFLVNNSSWQLLFSLYQNHSGTYVGFEFGFIEPVSKLFLKTIERTEIEEWANGLVQVVFFRPGKARPLPAAEGTLAFKPVKLYSQTSFVFETLLRKKAFMIACVLQDNISRGQPEDALTSDHVKLIKEKMASPREEIPKRKPESFLERHKVDDKIAEVDLHISELVDHFAGMSNADMLSLQMDYVQKCMDQAREEKLSKIIFIHGVGAGTLKNEILRFLRKQEDVSFYDASYARYGLGATEVSFTRNK